MGREAIHPPSETSGEDERGEVGVVEWEVQTIRCKTSSKMHCIIWRTQLILCK